MPIEPIEPSRRDNILSAAARLFATNGYDATSTSDIATAAGVSKALIYHHFSSKTEILYLTHHRVLSKGLEIAAREAKQDVAPDQKFKAILRGHVRLVLENVDSNLVLSVSRGKFSVEEEDEIQRMRQEYTRYLTSTYRDGITAGLLTDVDPEFAVTTALAACNWLYRWQLRGDLNSVSAITSAVVQLLFEGFQASPQQESGGGGERDLTPDHGHAEP